MSPNLDWTVGLISYVVFVYSTVCHEAGHAWAAWRLGDDTAYRGGQVSLDPTPHVCREPIGMVAVPILSFLLGGGLIGWASAPYDPAWSQRHPRRAALMALAGPAANLAFVLLAALFIRLGVEGQVFTSPDFADRTHVTAGSSGTVWESVALVLSIVYSLNLLLFIFNLMPVPPFDGSAVVMLLMNDRTAAKYQDFLANGTLRFFGLFVAWKVIGQIFPAVFFPSLSWLYPGMEYG